ncbi:MAG: tetratricopeptide repeat protein [Alphaproteobacteria bacterium]
MAEAAAHTRAGRHDAAAQALRKAAAYRPDDPAILTMLGSAELAAGRAEAAVALYRQALDIAPKLVPAAFNLGLAEQRLGRLEAAAAAYERALAADPALVEAWSNLGVLMTDLGRCGPAVEAFGKALALRPADARIQRQLARALRRCGRPAEAVAVCREAARLEPQAAESWSSLGLALIEAGEPEQAVPVLSRSLSMRPAEPRVWNNLGFAQHRRGDQEAAIFAYRRALALDPGFAEAHLNLAIALLLTGRMAEGWREFEWRWRDPQQAGARPAFAAPAWEGGPLDGRTILLRAEQGIGDCFQFVRYAPLLAARGARVVLECPPGMAGVLAGAPGVAQTVERGGALPAFDCYIPMMSLPLFCGPGLDRIPADVPYLRPGGTPSDGVAARTVAAAAGLRVGLVWAGNPRHLNERNRSIGLEPLAPLAAVPGCTLFGLQVGERAADLARFDWARAGWARSVTDLSPGLADWRDTAAVLAELDILVTVDTAIAHLAGAMGRPVWLLLPHVPDFRWLLDRTDSPWYPTMRLFRQRRRGAWDEPVAEAAAALAAAAACRASGAGG